MSSSLQSKNLRFALLFALAVPLWSAGCGQPTPGAVDVREGSVLDQAVEGGALVASPTSAVAIRGTVPGTFTWWCSGVLIGPRVVLTSAYCLEDGQANALAAQEVDVSLGGLGPVGGGDGSSAEAEQIILHPDFDELLPEGPRYTADLGLIVLHEEADVEVSPLLPDEQRAAHLIAGANLPFEGFGASNESGDSGPLRTINFEVEAVGATEVRMGSNNDAGRCHGDEGGPLYVDADADADGPAEVERFVIGIHSRPLDVEWGCGGDELFTLTPAFEDWIVDTVGDLYTPWQPPEPKPDEDGEPDAGPGPTESPDGGTTPEPDPDDGSEPTWPDVDPESKPDLEPGPNPSPEPQGDPEPEPAADPDDTDDGDAPPSSSGPDFRPPEPTDGDDAEASGEGFHDPKSPSAERPRTFVVEKDYGQSGSGCSTSPTSPSGWSVGALVFLALVRLRRRARAVHPFTA